MTVIVGLTAAGKCFLGGDSAGCDGWDLMVRRDPKVFRKGDFLIGGSGSYRVNQLVQYQFTPPEHPAGMDAFEFMCAAFVEALRESVKNGGSTLIKEGQEKSGGWLLVAYRGRLFRIDSDYQVGENVAPFDAIGCGGNFALGALDATPGGDPEERMTLALEAAERWCTGVRRPFTVLTLPAEEGCESAYALDIVPTSRNLTDAILSAAKSLLEKMK